MIGHFRGAACLANDKHISLTGSWRLAVSRFLLTSVLVPQYAACAHVGESCSMPSSAVGSVGNDKGAVYCFLFIPPSVAWAAGLSRWGYPPLNPGRPPERAGESTRTPLISPEKLALLRPARGAPLASSLAGFFRETGGQWGPHPRTSPCAPVWPTASAYGYLASEKSKP